MYSHGIPKVKIGGQEVPRDGLEQFEVHADLDQPDMADVTLTNIGGDNSGQYNPGDEVEISMHHEGETDDLVFKGKVISVHPTFDVHRPPSVMLTAMNELHELARERKTRTYLKQSEKQIIEKVAGEHNLSVDFGTTPPTIVHEHIHQSNQTDLSFLRLMAARSGREVRVQDKVLQYRKRQKDKGPVATLAYGKAGQGGGEDGGLEYFAPRMSSAKQVKKVTVKGWDPDKKQEIVGEATASGSQLGGSHGGQSRSDAPNLHVHNVPVRSKEEADAVAQSILEERLMDFITGTATARGNAQIKPGTVVMLKCYDQRFQGKYYVTGVKHRFTRNNATGVAGGAGLGGYRTEFSFKRDAEK